MELGCYAFTVYEGFTEEHWAFLTPEASKELDLYLEERRNDGENLTDESPLLRTSYPIGIAKVIPMTSKDVDQTMERIVRRANLREKNGNRYDKMLNHGFRKRFETIVKMNKDIPVAIAEKLIGHKAYYDDRGNHIQLDENYFVPEVEQLFQFFTKAISDITIDNSAKKQAEIDKLNLEKKRYQDQSSKIKNLESKLEILTHKIDLMGNTKEI
jgi:integrase/recombinase XerD